MKKLYLDMNIYNRPFDDQSQVRIRLETIATHALFQAIKEKKFAMLWSFMIEFENSLNPYDDIRMEIELTSSLSTDAVSMGDDILKTATELEKSGIKSRDALHLSCALKGKADYFLTCDDKLIKKAGFVKGRMITTNPVNFVRQEVR